MMFYKASTRGVCRPTLDELRQVARFSRAVHSFQRTDSVKLSGRENAVR